MVIKNDPYYRLILVSVISVNKFNNKISEVVGNILCEESSDEETVETLADLLIILDSTSS